MRVNHSSNTCLAPRRQRDLEGSYSRLYPCLPAYIMPSASLNTLGSIGGDCDGTVTQEEAQEAAGWPLFGQYLAHDLTADRSPLERIDHNAVENSRKPLFSLECLYGDGRTGAPYMFDWDDSAKFLLSNDGWDVPRNAQGIAIIADPRNDSHRLMNQLQVALIRAHNARVVDLRANGHQEENIFDKARKDLIWHYQWIVLNDFLPRVVGSKLVAAIRNGEFRFPDWNGLSIPYEFADAAYRYGHSQIRQSYQLTRDNAPVDLFPGMLGFRRLPEGQAITDWSLFFDRDSKTAQRSMKITEKLPAALLSMPIEITGVVKDEGYKSLANRDMQRGNLVDLPSGEAIATAMGELCLTAAQIGLGDQFIDTPLWYYILREAAVLEDGEQLGQLGGRIVAGVMIDLLESDPTSFLNVEPQWSPFLQSRNHSTTGSYGLINLLDYATST
jgi:hypothetical protein